MTNTKIFLVLVTSALTVCPITSQVSKPKPREPPVRQLKSTPLNPQDGCGGGFTRIRFAIQAKENVRIKFKSTRTTSQMVEIYLGLSNQSGIQLTGIGPTDNGHMSVKTPGILDQTEYRHFLLEWSPTGKIFRVFRGNDKNKGLTLLFFWTNPLPSFPPNELGVLTSANGIWICDGVYISESTESKTEYNFVPLNAAPINAMNGKSIPNCSVSTSGSHWKPEESKLNIASRPKPETPLNREDNPDPGLSDPRTPVNPVNGINKLNFEEKRK